MPIPGSYLNQQVSIGGSISLYTSICTFYSLHTTTDTTGQQLRTFAVVDSDHTNVKCRRSSLILIRPQTQEGQRGATFNDTQAKSQLNLARYFADIDVQWRVLVDGVMYEILSVEWDGNRETSRLMLGAMFPFSA